ncbi:ABC transporter, partial [Streptomyces sp. ActVer]|nr:ABC transporter [Streptomyces sp. ActVer]
GGRVEEAGERVEPDDLPVHVGRLVAPSLDDVYLRYAGRRYSEAEAAAAVTAEGTDDLALTGGTR